jgi:hypothetical protein
LVADEDLGKQSIVNGAERKSWMEQEVAFVLSATYVLTFNDKQRLEDEAAANSQISPLELEQRPRTNNDKPLPECLLQDLPELANVSNTFHEDRLDMLEVGRAL